jgi:hypothetical protein
MGNSAGGAVVGPRTEYEADIVRFIESDGCFVVSVFDEEESSSPFSYSIGFTKTLSQPEVVLYGLDRGNAHPLVNDAYSLCKNGLRLGDWVVIDDLFRDYRCIARAVDESWIIQSQFASALWYHQTQMGSGLQDVVQLVWPDADGAFPWEDGCADWVKQSQVALYEPRLAA